MRYQCTSKYTKGYTGTTEMYNFTFYLIGYVNELR